MVLFSDMAHGTEFLEVAVHFCVADGFVNEDELRPSKTTRQIREHAARQLQHLLHCPDLMCEGPAFCVEYIDRLHRPLFDNNNLQKAKAGIPPTCPQQLKSISVHTQCLGPL